MPTGRKDEARGGLEGPSESVESSQDALDEFARLLGPLLVTHQGSLTPEAWIQASLRKEGKRGELLEALTLAIMPSEVPVGLWLKWLNGGESPFKKGLKKPRKLEHGTGKELGRGPASLRPARERVERARAELAYAEQALAYQEALDRSLLDWSVTDHLIQLLSPVFAMGPAWAIMRAIAPHLSDEHANKMTLILDDDKDARADAIKELREKWKVQSNEAMEALDFFAGNPEFEAELRGAILGVTYRFSTDQKLRAEWQEKGGRRRSKEAVRTSINPESKKDAEEILDSFF